MEKESTKSNSLKRRKNYRVARHITLLKLKVIVLGFQPLHFILKLSFASIINEINI